jgi:hypothetical protein
MCIKLVVLLRYCVAMMHGQQNIKFISAAIRLSTGARIV